MKCVLCQGEMVRGSTAYHVDRRGYHITFDSIPAWVCRECGEPYFDESAVDEIQAAVREVDKHANHLQRAA